MHRVIGIAGLMGSGKDAVASALVEQHGYTRIAFADALRKEVEVGVRTKDYPDGMPLHLFEILLEAQPEDVYAKPTPDGMRQLLQWHGCFRREENQEHWIHILEQQIMSHPDQCFAISDVRFKNEADFIHRIGGEVWLVKRNGVHSNGIPGHISERLAGIIPDKVVDNNGTLDDLACKVDELCGNEGDRLSSMAS
jgi:hypothetical protein